jgi:hypothetical protein
MKRKLERAALFFVKSITCSSARKRRSGSLRMRGAAFLVAALSLTGCKDLENSDKEHAESPGKYVVTYEAGNGGGGAFTVKTGEDAIILPGSGNLVPPAYSGMSFAGWYDGMFTYAAGSEYTITRDAVFEARWGFTTTDEVTKYLAAANRRKDADGNTLLVVCYGGDLTWQWTDLVDVINEDVSLDLSASTLNLSSGTFMMSAVPNTVKKLLLPRAAVAVDQTTSSIGNASLRVVSGLNVTVLRENAFSAYSALEAAYFPAKISTVGLYAFKDCTALRTLYVPAMLPNALDIHPDLWTKTPWDVYHFANCKLSTITIGGNVKEAAGVSVVDNANNNFDTVYSALAGRAAGTYTWDTTKKWWKIYIPATGETIYTQGGQKVPVEADE